MIISHKIIYLQISTKIIIFVNTIFYYNDIHFIKEDGSLDITTCSSHQLILLSGMGYKNNDTLQNIGGMNIYPMIFQGANIYMREYKTSNKTYWIHYGNMSWFKNDIK